MKIAIYYEHAFTPIGAPVGIRNLAAGLSEKHEVLLWGKKTKLIFPSLSGVKLRQYTDFIDMCRQVPAWIGRDKPDVLMVVGFFLYQNLPVALAARRQGIPVVFYPLAQVWDTMFKGRIFTQGCDVRALEEKRLNSDDIKQQIANLFSPYWKRLYKYSVGQMLVQSSARIAVLSEVEQEQFKSYYSRPDSDFITLPYGIDLEDAARGVDDALHYYRDTLGYKDDIPNFIVWARLDWYYKGLDRLLEGVRVVKERQGVSAVPFRLFLCGPDYRGGILRVNEYVRNHGLDHLVHLLLPGSYTPGSKAPLRDADASVLLSPWDGSPRALRESLHLGVPLFVSRETNFTRLVEDFEAGSGLIDADDPQEVANGLLELASRRHLYHWKKGALELARYLDWNRVADRFAEDVSKLCIDHISFEKTIGKSKDCALQR